MKKMDKLLEALEKRYGDQIKQMVSRENDPFKVLIKTVLSQRTRDENTDQATKRLFEVGDSPKSILKIKESKLKDLIKSAGMYNQKAGRIKKIAEKILEDWDGETPNTREELMELPGVGYKTSAIVMMYGFNMPIIAVDVHVAVCARRLGLTQNEDVEKIRIDLEKIFPRNKWYLINQGFVKFGREICRTKNPRCDACQLNDICPYKKHVK